MTLNEWSAKTKRQVFESLISGQPPSIGAYEIADLQAGKAIGVPVMGTTSYLPDRVLHEFIYKDSLTTVVLTVTIESPERIVVMPVPSWVVENIWQGEISGSYHFETDAKKLFENFGSQLSVEGNAPLFGPKMATRRE